MLGVQRYAGMAGGRHPQAGGDEAIAVRQQHRDHARRRADGRRRGRDPSHPIGEFGETQAGLAVPDGEAVRIAAGDRLQTLADGPRLGAVGESLESDGGALVVQGQDRAHWPASPPTIRRSARKPLRSDSNSPRRTSSAAVAWPRYRATGCKVTPRTPAMCSAWIRSFQLRSP